MIYVDPFLGDVELIKLSENTRYAVGVFIEEIIYRNTIGDIYIFTKSDESQGTIQCIGKDLLNRINTAIQK